MSETFFTDQHEWVRLEGDTATVGITKYAAEALGDVVFVELPPKGRKVGAGAEAAVVESVKAASEVYSPVGGEVSEAKSDQVISKHAVVGRIDDCDRRLKVSLSELDAAINLDHFVVP